MKIFGDRTYTCYEPPMFTFTRTTNISYAQIEKIVDYLCDLRGEWRLKKSESAGNAEQYDNLCELIGQLKQITKNMKGA